jgi:hypothetical protein
MAIIQNANLNDVEAWGGEITQLPPGPYQLRIKSAAIEEKGSGADVKAQLVIDYEVLSGAFSSKSIKAWFSLKFDKDTPRKRLKSLIVASGIQLDSQGNFDTNQLVGCKLNADVIHETYESGKDPITGQAVEKLAVRVVNERRFAPLSDTGNANTGNAVPTNAAQSFAPNLPGLTPA